MCTDPWDMRSSVIAAPKRGLGHFLVSLWPGHAAVFGRRAPGQWPMDDKCVQRKCSKVKNGGFCPWILGYVTPCGELETCSHQQWMCDVVQLFCCPPVHGVSLEGKIQFTQTKGGKWEYGDSGRGICRTQERSCLAYCHGMAPFHQSLFLFPLSF